MVSIELSYQMLQCRFKPHAIGIVFWAEVRHHNISDSYPITLQQTRFRFVSRKED